MLKQCQDYGPYDLSWLRLGYCQILEFNGHGFVSGDDVGRSVDSYRNLKYKIGGGGGELYFNL